MIYWLSCPISNYKKNVERKYWIISYSNLKGMKKKVDYCFLVAEKLSWIISYNVFLDPSLVKTKTLRCTINWKKIKQEIALLLCKISRYELSECVYVYIYIFIYLFIFYTTYICIYILYIFSEPESKCVFYIGQTYQHGTIFLDSHLVWIKVYK